LDDVQEGHTGFLRGTTDERKIQEILIVVALERELVMVVTDERGLYLFDVKAQMFM
jgi:hypothetical protein